MKRLFIDIETSPNIALCWRAGGKNFVSPDNIVRERSVICIAYKWQGEGVVVDTWDHKQNDKAMLKQVTPIIASADEVVAHNGERFDLPWLRGRVLFHNLPPIPVVKTVDTLKWARKYYCLNSNRLDYIGKFIGVGGKTEKFKNGDGSWRRVLLDNDRDELAEMASYCARDVELLEQVWERLAVVCPPTVHAGVADGKDKRSCPRCGSYKTQSRGYGITAKGSVSRRLQCNSCRGYFQVSEKKAA